jgi:hypothetical protein
MKIIKPPPSMKKIKPFHEETTLARHMKLAN